MRVVGLDLGRGGGIQRTLMILVEPPPPLPLVGLMERLDGWR